MTNPRIAQAPGRCRDKRPNILGGQASKRFQSNQKTGLIGYHLIELIRLTTNVRINTYCQYAIRQVVSRQSFNTEASSLRALQARETSNNLSELKQVRMKVVLRNQPSNSTL